MEAQAQEVATSFDGLDSGFSLASVTGQRPWHALSDVLLEDQELERPGLFGAWVEFFGI